VKKIGNGELMLKSNTFSFFKILIISLFYFITKTNAQSFTASTDYTKIGENERFQVTFSLQGVDNSNISNFKAPTFNGFRILNGPSQSSSIQVINGKMSAAFSFTYILMPTSIGKFKIGSAQITQAGKTYTSNDLSIEVIKGQSQKRGGSSNDGSDEDISKSLFILAIPDKNTVYKGEQVTVTYKLFTRINISSPQISKLPQFNGFWTEELDLPNNISLSDEMHNGERFKSAVIKKAALFPTQNGQLTVSPFELKMSVVYRKKKNNRDIFDDFFDDPFFGRTETKEVLIKSNTIKINVLPLPQQNIPNSFNGAVGNFSLNASIDKNLVTQNEPFTLKFVISGTGNIKLAEIPQINLPTGFDKYEPKVTENINRIGKVNGTKTIEYLIVPRISGKHTIKPIEFSYFNPDSKKYETITTQSFEITVKRGSGLAGSDNNFDKEDIQLLNEDIRYIKTEDFDLYHINDFSLLTKWFWLFIIAPIIGLFISLRIIKEKEHLNANISISKFRKAEKFARKRLKSAKELLDANNLNAFYENIYTAVFGYLEDKLSISKAELTIDNVNEKLISKNIPEELIIKVKTLTEKCEFVRFAPQGINHESANDFYESTVLLIIELDEFLSGKKRK